MPGRALRAEHGQGGEADPARRARAGRLRPVGPGRRRHHRRPVPQPARQLDDLGRRGALLRPVHLGRAVRAGQRVGHVGREDDDGPQARAAPGAAPARSSAATSRSAASRPPRPGPPSGSPRASSTRAPSAWSRPAPPSVLALPPTPKMIRRAPASSAAASTSPAPKLDAVSGSRPPAGQPRQPADAGQLDDRHLAAPRVARRAPVRRSGRPPSPAPARSRPPRPRPPSPRRRRPPGS